MSNDALVLLSKRLQTLHAFVLDCRSELYSADDSSLHVAVLMCGRVLNILSSVFELDAHAVYMISMELNPGLMQLVSSDTHALHRLKSIELNACDRILSDLETRCSDAVSSVACQEVNDD